MDRHTSIAAGSSTQRRELQWRQNFVHIECSGAGVRVRGKCDDSIAGADVRIDEE